jgi:uncharacterized protein
LDEQNLGSRDFSQIAPQRQMRDMHWVFVGKDGLRAGWGALLFVFLYFVFLVLTNFIISPFLGGFRSGVAMPLRVALLMEFNQFLPAALATIIMARIEGRSPLAYGFQGKSRAIRLLFGLFWGLIACTVFLLVLWKSGLLAFDGEPLRGSAIVAYGLGWGLMFLMVAAFEESALRGYLQFTLNRGIGFWWGALLLSVLFGFTHRVNPGETPVGLFSAASIGLIFCLSLWYTGSLWWALGFHASWDWAESYLYGTSDSGVVIQGHLLSTHPVGSLLWSGGKTGPEGSILVFALIAVIVAIMVLWWGPRAESPFRGSAWKPERSLLRSDAGAEARVDA